MRKRVFILMVVAVALMAGSAEAQQKYPLGYGNFAVKVDYLRFTGSEMDDLGLANAPYIGAEFYFPIFIPSLYLGLEAGYAWSSGDRTYTFFLLNQNPINVNVDLDVDYVPIELNAKYVFDLSHCWALDFGGGLSVNYFSIDTSAEITGSKTHLNGDADWLFGGQFFMDLDYKAGPWLFGANIKYQLTDDISLHDIDTDVSGSNFRVGGQLGYMF